MCGLGHARMYVATFTQFAQNCVLGSLGALYGSICMLGIASSRTMWLFQKSCRHQSEWCVLWRRCSGGIIFLLSLWFSRNKQNESFFKAKPLWCYHFQVPIWLPSLCGPGFLITIYRTTELPLVTCCTLMTAYHFVTVVNIYNKSQGVSMYWCLRRSDGDYQNCLLYCGCPLLSVN